MRILWKAFVAGMALAFAFPVFAAADEIVNDLDTSADVALETMTLSFEGQSTTLRVRVTNDDGRNGCNFGGRGNPELVVAPLSSNPSVATVAPPSLTFDGCGDHQLLRVTAVGEGTTRITFQETSNTTQGSFNLDTGAFTVVVARPPTPTAVPTAAVVGDLRSTATVVVIPTSTATTEPPAPTATPELATATRTPIVLPIGGGGGGSLGGGTGINPARTPELGSLLLFGSGAAGMAGYAWARLRSRRRH